MQMLCSFSRWRGRLGRERHVLRLHIPDLLPQTIQRRANGIVGNGCMFVRLIQRQAADRLCIILIQCDCTFHQQPHISKSVATIPDEHLQVMNGVLVHV